ncbi:nucleoside triphosphate pyrophosphohydrolase family protein [Brevibacterium album]|uniref:nucleoside triphosphate pyrophosphohydrolase family protein n=1 Tax=Brevibacterium album TaxID=417948 RepID=UPI0006855F2C|nr:nucleoside triphosphate pyrophosphohydrolase family protein [Brevibacterium album]
MSNQDRVNAWNQAAGNYVGDAPLEANAGDVSPIGLRRSLLEEEFEETDFALRDLEDYAAYEDETSYRQAMIEVADGLADLLYVAYGIAGYLGFDLDEVFAEVARSNDSKIDWSTGRAWAYRDDGKITKDDHYEAPRIEEIIYGSSSR